MGLCLELTKDSNQRKNFRKIMKGAVADISSNPKVRALGLNDMETFHWLWEKKYVKKPFDPTVIRIEDA